MLAEILNFQGAKPISGMGSLSILFYACPETVHERLMQRKTLTRYEKEGIGFEQQVIRESVAFLSKRNVTIFNVSTECSIEESVSETYNIIMKYICET